MTLRTSAKYQMKLCIMLHKIAAVKVVLAPEDARAVMAGPKLTYRPALQMSAFDLEQAWSRSVVMCADEPERTKVSQKLANAISISDVLAFNSR